MHHDRLSMLGKMAACMAHELRNPLFAIERLVGLLKTEINPFQIEKVNTYLSVIDHEIKTMYRQITSFLSFSKNKGAEEPFVPRQLIEIVQTVLELTQPRLTSEKIELDIESQSRCILEVQEIGLQQVICNLINNSIDALMTIDSSRKITIRLYEDNNCGYLSIRDNGPGIPDNLKSRLFEPFATEKAGGTGLGLAISNQIILKHYGELTFQSQKGNTEFVVTIPKEKIKTESKKDAV